MKTLKSIVSASGIALATFLLISLSGSSFAQQNPGTVDQKQETKTAGTKSNEELKKDYDQRMQKYDEMYRKLEQKAQSTNDPQMKADIQAFQAKMQKLKNDYEGTLSRKDSMTEQERQQAHERLHAQMEDLKKDYDQLKTKYGKTTTKGAGKAAEDKQPKEKNKTETTPKQ